VRELKDFDLKCFRGRYRLAADPFDKLRAGSAAAKTISTTDDQPFAGTDGGASSGARYVPIDRNSLSLEFA